MTVVPFHTDAEIDAAIPSVVAHLRRGGILAHPTETVYGFGGAVTPESVATIATTTIATLKNRSPEKQLLVLISSLEMLDGLGVQLTDAARALSGRYWPGPLTLVLPPTNVAVRWTSHAGMARLVAHHGTPITSTSANRVGVPPAASAEEIAREWNEAIAQGVLRVLDGGPLPNRLPSTVVDCTSPIPHMLREGAVTVAQLRTTVPEVVVV